MSILLEAVVVIVVVAVVFVLFCLSGYCIDT